MIWGAPYGGRQCICAFSSNAQVPALAIELCYGGWIDIGVGKHEGKSRNEICGIETVWNEKIEKKRLTLADGEFVTNHDIIAPQPLGRKDSWWFPLRSNRREEGACTTTTTLPSSVASFAQRPLQSRETEREEDEEDRKRGL